MRATGRIKIQKKIEKKGVGGIERVIVVPRTQVILKNRHQQYQNQDDEIFQRRLDSGFLLLDFFAHGV